MRGAGGAGEAANAMVAIMLGRYIYIYLIFLAYMCLTVHMPFPESTQLLFEYYQRQNRDNNIFRALTFLD